MSWIREKDFPKLLYKWMKRIRYKPPWGEVTPLTVTLVNENIKNVSVWGADSPCIARIYMLDFKKYTF